MSSSRLQIGPDRFDAAIFDLDGVVTQTARVHAAAWKTLFDTYLRDHAARSGTAFVPFDARDDYLLYVDGKPRADGVHSFLASRGIALPWGRPDDAADVETVCGIGNRKNALFLAEVRRHGVEPYASTLRLIRELRAAGLKTAVISSSKNCALVLEAAGVTGQFDAAVDGLESVRIGIAGKPAPDIFLEAARRLGVIPARAVVVEDAISGVQAGHAGGFGCVVGVHRGSGPERLSHHGADVVVSDLSQVGVGATSIVPAPSRDLPSAFERIDALTAAGAPRPAVFLDYDGTLTPIVPRPEDAVLAPAVRQTVSRLAGLCPVAIISGRDLADVRRLVGIEGIVYAGSHGFDIAGPQGPLAGGSGQDRFLPLLAAAEAELRQALAHMPGAQIERKKFSIAVHYRNVADADRPALEDVVSDLLAREPSLRDLPGKKVHDLQPRIDWDKGKALLQTLRALGLDGPGVLPIYIGDDITDEDAFAVLRERGLGIVVRDEARPSVARAALDSAEDVHRFLAALLERLEAQRR